MLCIEKVNILYLNFFNKIIIPTEKFFTFKFNLNILSFQNYTISLINVYCFKKLLICIKTI